MRRRILAVAFLSSLVVAASTRADNSNTVVVLHAVGHTADADCRTPEQAGFNCSVTPSTVQVSPDADIDVYVYAYGADSLNAIALGFEWHESWTFLSWHHCPSNWVALAEPSVASSSLIASFDCLTVPIPESPLAQLLPIGILRMRSGVPGTSLAVGEANGPDGTAVVDCSGETFPIPQSQWSRIGVDEPGVDGCRIVPSKWGVGVDMF